jgi:hypothetical protein
LRAPLTPWWGLPPSLPRRRFRGRPEEPVPPPLRPAPSPAPAPPPLHPMYPVLPPVPGAHASPWLTPLAAPPSELSGGTARASAALNRSISSPMTERRPAGGITSTASTARWALPRTRFVPRACRGGTAWGGHSADRSLPLPQPSRPSPSAPGLPTGPTSPTSHTGTPCLPGVSASAPSADNHKSARPGDNASGSPL